MASVDPQGHEGHQASAPDDGGRGFGSLGRLLLWLGFISLVLVVLIIVAPVDSWFREATRQAREVDGLFKFMLAASAVVFVYIQGLTLAFALQYRRRKRDSDSDLGTQLHGHTRLETAWSVVPSIFLVVLAVVSLRILGDENAHHANEIRVDAYGFQYGFAFDLPQYGVKNAISLTLPVNRPIYVVEHSRDVIHAFWVPEFRIQYDMVPGVLTYQHFTPVETGTFRIVCTQFCGPGHSGMFSAITVGTGADFITYLRTNHATRLPASGATAAVVQP